MVIMDECNCVKYGCCVCEYENKPKPCPGNFKLASQEELISRMDKTSDVLECEYINKILDEEYGDDKS